MIIQKKKLILKKANQKQHIDDKQSLKTRTNRNKEEEIEIDRNNENDVNDENVIPNCIKDYSF